MLKHKPNFTNIFREIVKIHVFEIETIHVFGSCENKLDYTRIVIVPYNLRDPPFDSLEAGVGELCFP